MKNRIQVVELCINQAYAPYLINLDLDNITDAERAEIDRALIEFAEGEGGRTLYAVGTGVDAGFTTCEITDQRAECIWVQFHVMDEQGRPMRVEDTPNPYFNGWID